MAEMGIAYIARCLDPAHSMTVVLMIRDHAWRHGLGKTRPAGMALILACRIEQHRITAKTLILSWLEQSTQVRAVCPLSVLQTCDTELVVCKKRTPLRIRLLYSARRRRIAVTSQTNHIIPLQSLS